MDHHPDPIDPVDETAVDQTAIPNQGRPTVWSAPPAQQPGCFSHGVARRLLTELTQRGDVVLDIDDDIAFAATAATAAITGRRSHALGGDEHLAAMGHAVDTVDLILIHWPRPAVDPSWLLTACWSLAGAAGWVVIAVDSSIEQRVEHLRALAGAAATARLRIVEHVAVIAPDPRPPQDPCPEAATPVATANPRPPRHGRHGRHHGCIPTVAQLAAGAGAPHLDLLVLAGEEAGDE
jgi:hypothetical protein